MRVPPVQRSTFAVKVCGVRRPQDAEACAAAGVDFAGFNRVVEARRCVGVEALAGLLAALGPVQPVLLYRDAPVAQILRESSQLDISWIQLHGGESLELGRTLASAGLRLIRALPDTADRQTLTDWLDVAEVLLVDGADPGSGQARNWRLPSGADPARVWLAGGLTPTNVAQALGNAPAAGVDAASGLESDGLLDPQKIADFAHAARKAAAIRSQG